MEQQTFKMHAGESRQLTLQSRATTGLKLQFKTEPDDIVEVKKLASQTVTDTPPKPGAPMPAVFELKALAKGTAQVTFFESRPWDASFKPIVQQVITVQVQ